VAGQRPCARGNVAAGQDESTIVQLDEVAAGDLFTLASPDVLECQGFQAGLAMAVGNSGAEPDSDAGGRLQLGDELVGHAGQRLAMQHRSQGPGSSDSPARDCCDNRTLTVA
jgi:hypothetical protein